MDHVGWIPTSPHTWEATLQNVGTEKQGKYLLPMDDSLSRAGREDFEETALSTFDMQIFKSCLLQENCILFPSAYIDNSLFLFLLLLVAVDKLKSLFFFFIKGKTRY